MPPSLEGQILSLMLLLSAMALVLTAELGWKKFDWWRTRRKMARAARKLGENALVYATFPGVHLADFCPGADCAECATADAADLFEDLDKGGL